MILISKTLDLSYFHVGAQQDLACHGLKDVGVVSGFTRSLTHSQESEEEEEKEEGEDDNKLQRGREGRWRSLL